MQHITVKFYVLLVISSTVFYGKSNVGNIEMANARDNSLKEIPVIGFFFATFDEQV